jgi:hypothetical protein
MTRWNAEFWKWRGLPDLPTPFSPVQLREGGEKREAAGRGGEGRE